MTAAPDALATAQLLGALRLASPALPIGAFSYSQGLETAIERGWVRTERDLHDWLHDLLAHVVARFEAPLVRALCEAVACGDAAGERRLHALYLAARETAELRAESVQMGHSLQRLLRGLARGGATAPGAHAGRGAGSTYGTGIGTDAGTGTDAVRPGAASGGPDAEGDLDAIALPLAWARAARAFGLAPAVALAAYLWAWLENQVTAAIKAMPLGQQAGQRLLSALAPALAEACDAAARLPEAQWSNFAPGLALASSWHETQYTRIFRS